MVHQDLILEYLKPDVMLLPRIHQEYIKKLNYICQQGNFRRVNQISPFNFTISLSHLVVKEIFPMFVHPMILKSVFSVDHQNRELIRLSYHGGRVTVNNIAPHYMCEVGPGIDRYIKLQEKLNHMKGVIIDKPLYYVDINSSYPFIMTKAMPMGLATYFKDETLLTLERVRT